MLFLQGDYSKSEYKQRFKEEIIVLESYNSGVLFGNSPEAGARELALMGINTETVGNKEKAQKLTRGEYLATALLFILDRRRYGELILSFKNN